MKVIKEERLIDYLKQFKNYKTLLKNGSVLVDGKVITKYDYILNGNEVITINKYNKSKDIKIIYEDKDIGFDMDFDYVVCPQCESVNPIIWKRKYRGGNSKNGKFI